MRIGRYVEVLEIVPDETPGLGPDVDAEWRQVDAHAFPEGPRLASVGEAQGRSAAHAS